jgi:aspartokinase-like uncharacterized kinase
MWVVKLGGSLHDAPVLVRWLRLLATADGPPRIVVPGGGPFADAVRRLQAGLGFDDLAAHRMAILAMQQFALHLHGLEPRLALAEEESELRAAATAAHARLWLPWRLAGREGSLAASWALTSDSLACWLATRLDARVLLLVKSGAVPAGERGAEVLAASGLVDPAFPGLAARFAGEVRLVHRDRPPAALASGCLERSCRVVTQVEAAASSASGSSASTTIRATR